MTRTSASRMKASMKESVLAREDLQTLPQALPYGLTFQEVKYPSSQAALPALQSYAYGFAGANGGSSKWLLVGGRTQGEHAFLSPPQDSFPFASFNQQMFVIDPENGQTWAFDLSRLPDHIRDPLQSTNQESYYDPASDRLYIIGGFGWGTRTSQMFTFPTITSFKVGEMIKAITASLEDPDKIGSLIRQSTDPNFAVTGGGLRMLDNRLFQVFGQFFSGFYEGFGGGGDVPYTQEYTEELRVWKMDPSTLAPLIYGAIGTQDLSHPFHRRDLNAQPAIDPVSGKERIAVFGGVFVPGANLPFGNPIYIDATQTAFVDRSFSQKANLYECPVVPVYDEDAGAIYYTFFGGITHHFAKGEALLQDDGLPFSNEVCTVSYTPARSPAYAEYLLPGGTPDKRFIGASGRFILNPLLYGNQQLTPNGVIKLNALEPGSSTLVGYIYGGIESPAAQPEGAPTFSTNSVFRVYLNYVPSPGIPIHEDQS